MAFSFHFCIDLVVVHPSFDPAEITRQITELKAKFATKAGDERFDIRGRSRGSKAVFSVWSAPLHEAKRLHSETAPISEFILAKLIALERHREFFRMLNAEGQVELRVGWFSDSSHSATLLQSATINKCAELGLEIELNFYSPRENHKLTRIIDADGE